MAETPDSLLNVVNASGFPFQLRVEQEIDAKLRFEGWEVTAREHYWRDQGDDADGFIDLVIRRSNVHAVLECKREREASWTFLRSDDNPSETTRLRLLYTLLEAGQTPRAAWKEFDVHPPSPEATFCVVRGHSDRNPPMLERIASLVIRSTEALAIGQVRIAQPSSPGKTSLYVPVVVTTANLYLCKVGQHQIELETGNIPADAAEFQPVPAIRFRKGLNSSLGTESTVSDLRQANLEGERSVLVVNASALVSVFKGFEVIKR